MNGSCRREAIGRGTTESGWWRPMVSGAAARPGLAVDPDSVTDLGGCLLGGVSSSEQMAASDP
jgi:hypothetical protein